MRILLLTININEHNNYIPIRFNFIKLYFQYTAYTHINV